MAAAGSITISQGCDYDLSVTIYDTDGSKKDLTDYDVRFRVSNKTLSTRYIDITGTENGIPTTEGGSAIATDPVNGLVEVRVHPHSPEELPTNNEEKEESFVQANNVYSLVIIHKVSGKITKILQGDCYTEPEL